jgi:hypothetical protein
MPRRRGRKKGLLDLLAALTAGADANTVDWWEKSIMALIAFEDTPITISELDPNSEVAAEVAVQELLEGTK